MLCSLPHIIDNFPFPQLDNLKSMPLRKSLDLLVKSIRFAKSATRVLFIYLQRLENGEQFAKGRVKSILSVLFYFCSTLASISISKGKTFLSSLDCISPLPISNSEFIIWYRPVPDVCSFEHTFLLSKHKS